MKEIAVFDFLPLTWVREMLIAADLYSDEFVNEVISSLAELPEHQD